MLHYLHTHWLWLFGALSFGIAAGWVVYFLVAAHWRFRPVQVPVTIVAIGVVLAVAKLVPVRYGFKLEVGLYLAILAAIGGFVGWSLRDIAEFMPAASRRGVMTPGAGSYLFRDVLAGTGAGSAYMRTAGAGAQARARLPSTAAPARVRLTLPAAALIQAPAPGGYTFPKVQPDDAAPPFPRTAATGPRRHWTWPAG